MKVNLDSLTRRTRKQVEQIGVRVDPKTKAKLAAICKAEGLSFSQLIGALIKEFVVTYNDKREGE